ncbi:hypothetical protein [Mariniflexile sp.]|uniref:hypothetical protein n=1 Tax=Mariniflexile sp. TaxID=1979402 RepID=UPI004048D0DE
MIKLFSKIRKNGFQNLHCPVRDNISVAKNETATSVPLGTPYQNAQYNVPKGT